jgi:hypothetical protein
MLPAEQQSVAARWCVLANPGLWHSPRRHLLTPVARVVLRLLLRRVGGR